MAIPATTTSRRRIAGLLAFLAWRDLLSSPLIALILVAAVAAGVGFQVPNTANILGYEAEMLEQGVRSGFGDVRIHPRRGRRIEQPALDLSRTRQTGAVSEVGFANCGESLKEVPVSSSKLGLKSLQCGEKVTILGRSGAWIRIRTKDNAEGFVADRFIGQTKE